ncbi:Alpha/Beta hydrolase protein [Delphinella strobiligena]|nr:Alpha/Beta hydrolase protein [Delphinella strobiligena]
MTTDLEALLDLQIPAWLTSGLFNDTKPQWHPDGKSIDFLSDRAKQGKSHAIYQLSLSGGEAFPLTPAENEKEIAAFEWSPDGKFIAYLSPDEKTTEQKDKEEKKDDAQVYGEEWEFNRLRLLHVATKTVEILVKREAHVNEASWSGDGKTIAFTTQGTTEFESAYDGATLEYVSVADKKATVVSEANTRMRNICWSGQGIFFTAGADTVSNNTSQVLYSVSIQTDGTCEKRAGGDIDCAGNAIKAGDTILINIASGLQDEIRSLDGKIFVREMTSFEGWHAVSPSSGEIVIAWVSAKLQQISKHRESLKVAQNTPTALSVKSSDGEVTLDGLFLAPKSEASEPFPTVVIIHGGPYWRATGSFMPDYGWAQYLLSSGYAVLYPNYRGGLGHGGAFAAYVRGKIGTMEYDDVITLTQHCIDKKLIDKEKLIVGGWSQGGFLSYLSAVRNGVHGLGWKFKGAICGAGVTDWDLMAMTSDVPGFESELGGVAPWAAAKSDIQSRKGSPIWELAEAAKAGRVPPVLLLHGEKDDRVPISQA